MNVVRVRVIMYNLYENKLCTNHLTEVSMVVYGVSMIYNSETVNSLSQKCQLTHSSWPPGTLRVVDILYSYLGGDTDTDDPEKVKKET